MNVLNKTVSDTSLLSIESDVKLYNASDLFLKLLQLTSKSEYS